MEEKSKLDVVNLTKDGLLIHEYEIPAHVYSEKFFVRPCTVVKFADKTFFLSLVKLDGTFFTYLYIHGDQGCNSIDTFSTWNLS